MMNKTNIRYATYNVKRDGHTIAQVDFPNDVRNANFGGVCFYNANTDSFLDTTDVNVDGRVFTLERVA